MTFFFDKTWGFGIVKRLDDFYKRVVLDFTAKKNHAMSLEYAAETLKLGIEAALREEIDPEIVVEREA